jgi:hypothetical protein
LLVLRSGDVRLDVFPPTGTNQPLRQGSIIVPRPVVAPVGSQFAISLLI